MRIVFTIGIFDIIEDEDKRLFHEMRKVSIPGGELHAFVYEDYPAYKINKKFPVQSYSHRVRNIKYFIRNFQALEFEEPGSRIEGWRNECGVDNKFICVMYDYLKDFPGRSTIKKLGIPIKFIKYAKENNDSNTA